MPGRDGRGPREQGPLTGRGMGFCVEPVTSDADYQKNGFGRGRGRGGGQGRRGGRGGWRHRFLYRATGLFGWQRAATPGPDDDGRLVAPILSKQQELTGLKQQAMELDQALSELKMRIQKLETPEADGSSTGKEER
jgi:hypothetical protein